jgi:hypothetical protein
VGREGRADRPLFWLLRLLREKTVQHLHSVLGPVPPGRVASPHNPSTGGQLLPGDLGDQAMRPNPNLIIKPGVHTGAGQHTDHVLPPACRPHHLGEPAGGPPAQQLRT